MDWSKFYLNLHQHTWIEVNLTTSKQGLRRMYCIVCWQKDAFELQCLPEYFFTLDVVSNDVMNSSLNHNRFSLLRPCLVPKNLQKKLDSDVMNSSLNHNRFSLLRPYLVSKNLQKKLDSTSHRILLTLSLVQLAKFLGFGGTVAFRLYLINIV